MGLSESEHHRQEAERTTSSRGVVPDALSPGSISRSLRIKRLIRSVTPAPDHAEKSKVVPQNDLSNLANEVELISESRCFNS